MEWPRLKEFKIHIPDGEPRYYDWQRADGSSVFAVFEPIISAVLPKASPGATVLLLEEALHHTRRPPKIVFHGIETFTDSGEQLNRLVEMRRALFDTERVVLRLTDMERDFFQFWIEQRGPREKLTYHRPPMTNGKNGAFGYHMEMVRELLRAGSERVFFQEGSEIPSLMAAIPEVSDKPLTDSEFPAQAAVAYGLAEAVTNRTEVPGPQQQHNQKPWDPWDILEEGNRSSPGKWDPWDILKQND